ncbi:MAG: zf-TFIIB domain-containing protein [Verrucomicrobiia bacterium]
MNCPVCGTSLNPVQAGNVTVDVCVGGCGGIWFDIFELKKLDEPHETAAEMLVEIQRGERRPADQPQRRKCPRCPDIVMMRHFYSPRRRVEVDECPSCGGFWLDAGELALIREEHKDEEAQKAAIAEYLDAASASILGPIRLAGDEQTVRARRIELLFRFTRPIRYRRKAAQSDKP